MSRVRFSPPVPNQHHRVLICQYSVMFLCVHLRFVCVVHGLFVRIATAGVLHHRAGDIAISTPHTMFVGGCFYRFTTFATANGAFHDTHPHRFFAGVLAMGADNRRRVKHGCLPDGADHDNHGRHTNKVHNNHLPGASTIPYTTGNASAPFRHPRG